MKRWAALVIVSMSALSVLGGVRPSREPAPVKTRVWAFGDLHYNRPVGDVWKGVQRWQRMMNLRHSRKPNAIIMVGDYPWWSANDDATRDTIAWYLADTLLTIGYVTIGNHEYADPDTGTGRLYNEFIEHLGPGHRLDPWVSNTNRGSRWWGARVGNSNVVLFAGQNNRDVSSGAANYWPNNPKDGSGVLPYDFDGISDSTSAQRQALRIWAQGFVQPVDWPVYIQHRASHKLVTISNRPNMEGAHSNPDDCPVTWLDNYFGRTYFLIEADAHENKALKQHGRHVTLSACMAPRTKNLTDLATWNSYIRMFALSDSVYPAGALRDSLGAQNTLQPGQWNLLWEIDFYATYADVKALLIQKVDAVAVVDSFRVYR